MPSTITGGHSDQHTAAPRAAQPPAGHPCRSRAERIRRSARRVRRAGIPHPLPGIEPPRLIAFVASLLAVVIGSILAFFGGIQSGSLAQFAGAIDSNGNVESGALPASANQIALAAGALSVAAFLVWGAFALWGLIQGIIAGVKNRGRGWGIAAIVLSVVGGGIVFVFFVVGAGIGAAPYAS